MHNEHEHLCYSLHVMQKLFVFCEVLLEATNYKQVKLASNKV